MQRIDVVIVGGGAAGLMCAVTAGQRGRSVVVIERADKVGKKILISGGGRCNFTNVHTAPDNFISANPHFCKSALARFTPADFIAMVEHHGIAYHEKELGQLFCDGSSKQIVGMLLHECHRAGVRIEVSAEVTDVLPLEGGGFELTTTLGKMRATSLVIASGGLSIPKMGATGFGYTIAEKLGHPLQPTRPALVPLLFGADERARWKGLAGVSTPAAVATAGHRWVNGLLFTHRGLSGPVVLQASSYWQPAEPFTVDLAPTIDAAAWLEDRQRQRPAAELRTTLAELLPRKLADRLCDELLLGEEALPSYPMRRFSGPEIAAIAGRLHALRFHLAGTEGYRTAEVTAGGVDTDGLSSQTMESRLVPGLYFIGEVVDVTGHLGGFNFQWAWASGQAAGLAA